MQYDFTNAYTIKTRHILDAIPGATNRDKLDWVRAAKRQKEEDGNMVFWNEPSDCWTVNDTDAAARAMAKALGEIEETIQKYHDSKIPYCYHAGDRAIRRIVEIVDGVE